MSASEWEPGDSASPDRPVLRDQDGRFLRGTNHPNPMAVRAKRASLLGSIKRILAANPHPETGEGKLAGDLSAAYLRALVEASSETNAERAAARKVFLDCFLGLMNRVDPPRAKVELEMVRRVVIMGPRLPKFSDPQLQRFVTQQQKALSDGQPDPAVPPEQAGP